MRREILTLALAFSVAAAGEACRRAPEPTQQAPAAAAPVAVSGVELGNAINADKSVTAKSDTFKPTDTIYVSVKTTGSAASAAVGAKWTYEDGQVVNESAQAIAPTGPATTEFHISKPDGWPEGGYKVEVTLNGTPAGSASFTVKK